MTNELHVFTEIFPVHREALPPLTLYQLKISGGGSLDEIGRRLSIQLQRKFGGHWKWDIEKKYVIADTPQDASTIRQFLQEQWDTSNEEDVLRSLEDIEATPNDAVASIIGIANFVAGTLQDDFSKAIDRALAQHKIAEKRYYVNRGAELRGWVVDDHPAVSVSIKSSIELKGDLKTYFESLPCPTPDQLIGLNVIDKTKPDKSSMRITGIGGKLGQGKTRDRLLAFKPHPAIKALIEQASSDELVVNLNGKYDYIVSALKIKVHSEDYPRFKINERLQIEAAQRVEYIRLVSSIIKRSGLVGQSYSTKTHELLFLSGNDIDYNPRLKVGDGQIVSPDSIFRSLKKSSLYKPTSNKKIRIAILNASPQTSLDRLQEGLRRELGKNLQYNLRLAIRREISRASREFIEPAIEEIAKEKPDIILGIIPNPDFDTDEWTPYDEFKHLTLKKNLQSQVIQPANVNNHYIMENVVLGILAKTGNIPYILAEPITYADLIVGLDVARQKKRNLPGTINSAGVARIYFSNGELMQYNIREAMLEGEIIPPHILQDIFPRTKFSRKNILIHRDGNLPDSEKETLMEWGNKIGTMFNFVEVIKSGNPRLYGSQKKKTIKAPKGKIMKLSETEALLVSSEFPAGFKATPQPIRVRTHPPFPLEHALHSVLSLTLLHYGSIRIPRLPVTIHYADKICSMAAKGLKPNTQDGAIPFWL